MSAALRPIAAVLAVVGALTPAPGARAAPLSHRHHAIGVLAHRPKPQALAAWMPFRDALARAIPCCEFTLEVLDYVELEEALRQDRLDIVITNPGHYVGIRGRVAASGVLATVVERGPDGPLWAYGGTIFARADRDDLRSLSDLGHARIAAVGTEALAGYQAQVYELVRAGVPLPSPDRLQLTGQPHDKVVAAVLERRADVGFVRSGTLEAMARAGRISLDAVKIIHRQDLPDYPYAVSTRLYPEWPVVALPRLDEDHARTITSVLLGLDGPVGGREVTGVDRFTIPADYTPVEEMLRALRLPPYESAPAFGPQDVLRRYLLPLLGLAAVVAAIAGLSIYVVVVNRRLERARCEAQDAVVRRERALVELREAMTSMRMLKGLLPICMYCHKIRKDQVSWDRLETYLSEHSEAQFTHSICPSCYAAQFPEQT